MRIGMSAVYLDGLVEFGVVILFMTIAVLTSYSFWNPPSWLFFPMVLGYLTFVFFFIILFSSSKKFFVLRFFDFLYKRMGFIRRRIEREHFFEIYKTFKENITVRKSTFAKAIVATFFARLFDFLRIYFILAAFGINLSVLEITIFYGCIYLLFAIPATPGSLGIAEGGEIFVLSLLGVAVPMAAAFTFVERLFTFWFITILGSIVAFYYGIDVWKDYLSAG